MVEVSPDLTVRGEPVERIYSNFVDRRYVVNRRYQRKLIWTLEEKQKFIDSISKGFPVPIILLAESAARGDNSLEIIDGMQRLDAVVSFIGNGFDLDGEYFDLNTVATTKAQLDGKLLTQKTPVMERERCVRIASYLLPLSIYEFADEDSIDEVFRRINSGGRQLSRQELRSAGATGSFANVVRIVSAKVRKDTSASDLLRLNEMQKISITNRDLDYGINADSVFWVANGILSREHLRQSRDEELVADIVGFMASDEPISSRTEFLDDFYGNFASDKTSQERYAKIDLAIKRRSEDLFSVDFQRTYDAIALTLASANSTFTQLLFGKAVAPMPRYFQAVFLAFYDLVVEKNLEVSDRQGLVKALTGCGPHIVIQEGGRWGGDNREKAINAVIGMIQSHFSPAANRDPAIVHWINQLENILMQSYTEQVNYDFKQGFVAMDGHEKFDDNSFSKILKTCSAIANCGRGQKGYVLIGVSEDAVTASKIEATYKSSPIQYERFFVTGVEHEAKILGKDLDQLFQLISDKIKRSTISDPLKSYITSNMKSVRYYDKTVYVLEVLGQVQPSLYDGKYFSRVGSQVNEVLPEEFGHLFRRFT